jgi:hypothetical protein
VDKKNFARKAKFTMFGYQLHDTSPMKKLYNLTHSEEKKVTNLSNEELKHILGSR